MAGAEPCTSTWECHLTGRHGSRLSLARWGYVSVDSVGSSCVVVVHASGGHSFGGACDAPEQAGRASGAGLFSGREGRVYCDLMREWSSIQLVVSMT